MIKTRTSLQNRQLHRLLRLCENHIEFPFVHIDESGGVTRTLKRADVETWKRYFSAHLNSAHYHAQGLNGDVVLITRSTSDMTLKELTMLIEMIECFLINRGINILDSASKDPT